MAYHAPVAGERPTAAQWLDWVFRRCIADFTSSTRPASPLEGQPGFETDTDKLLLHDGTSWIDVGKLGAWTAYTPTWATSGTPCALGNGTVTGRYHKIFGRTYFVEIFMQAGSTTTFGTGTFSFTIPGALTGVSNLVGQLYINDSSATPFAGVAFCPASTLINCFSLVGAADPRLSGVSATTPMTWATNDYVLVGIVLETTT